MAAKYISSTDTTNFARLSRLVVDVCCDLLRSVLDDKLPPPGLKAILQSQRVHLSNKNILEYRQQQFLYPSGGVFLGTLEDLDFSLLYKLVRNLQGINIPQHKNGWGKTPDNADRTLSANIDRLRVQRNEAYGHLPTASLSDTDFKHRWDIIRQCVFEIEKDALTGDTYVTAVDALLTTSMDPDTEKYYIEELEKQYKANLEVKAIALENKGAVADVATEQKSMALDIGVIKASQEVMTTNISDVATRQDVMTTNISDVATRQEVMTTNISDVATRQEVMTTNISDVATRQDVMTANISDVATRQDVMTANISDVATRQDVMTTNISDVATRQDVMTTNIRDVTTRQETIAGDIHIIKGNVAAVKDTLNATAANTRHTKDSHPDLVPMIETTKAMITEEVKKTFINTKAFRDAKEKLQNNRVVVIKGNTGDGKTCTAIQLLHWLIEEQHDRQPVQIHNIKDFKLLAPKSKIITFVDDIFGEKDLREKEVQEWNKRINSAIPSLFGDLQTEANFLVITVRNEVFSSLKKCSLGTVFIDLNITDMGTNTYKITEEKKELLDLYEPKNSKFSSWAKKEKEEIVKCAPNVGFPQCCRLFRDFPELQKERVQFFQKPLYFLNEALSKLGECPALLFLFLNDGMIKVKDLDPNSKQINKTLLEEAFEIDLIDGDDDRTSLKYKKKVEFVKKSLDKLLGFLVVKEKHWWFDGGELRNDVYRFYHDSIYVAVALLYGEKTPIGYIQNCPRKSLSYITTSKTSLNMIVISSDHYTDMCERLLREFVSEENDYGTNIWSLDVWKDHVFVESFVRLLNDRKVDKCAVLNKACKYGAEECALYLLSKGVKPDKDTPFCVVRGGCVKVLKTIVNDLNDEMKLAVLNKACESGSEECALYLLSEGVKPDKDTPFCVVRRGWVKVLKTIVNDLNDEMKLAVLNKACESGSEECALYLLSVGVKPDKYTPFCVVWRGCVKVLREILQYDVTPTARYSNNHNVLLEACWCGTEEMVTVLCDAYPHLVHDTDSIGLTPLHVAAWEGNCCMFDTVERTVRKSLCRVEDEQHKCETVDGRVVHVSCACAQYMSQLVNVCGWTVLHVSCMYGDREMCKFVWESYPALTSIVDKDGGHCLHHIASDTSDVDLFTECETHVKQYLESTGREYDITTIRDSRGRSVLDCAKERGTENNPLYDHLVKVFGSK